MARQTTATWTAMATQHCRLPQPHATKQSDQETRWCPCHRLHTMATGWGCGTMQTRCQRRHWATSMFQARPCAWQRVRRQHQKRCGVCLIVAAAHWCLVLWWSASHRPGHEIDAHDTHQHQDQKHSPLASAWEGLRCRHCRRRRSFPWRRCRRRRLCCRDPSRLMPQQRPRLVEYPGAWIATRTPCGVCLVCARPGGLCVP